MKQATRTRRGLPRLGLVFALGLFTTGAVAATQGEELVESARGVLEEWVETRRIISKEKRDWALGKELLEDRIELVRREIASLRERVDEAKDSIDDAEEKRVKLVEEKEALKQASAILVEQVAAFEGRTRELLTRLPDPLLEHVKPISQRLPENSEETELGLGERFLNLVGLLNEVDRFNREVKVTTEVRELEDGSTAEVTVLYIGLGQAFYVSASGKAAGTGRIGEDGWVWTPANEAAEAIALAVAIHEGEEAAGFVQLPVGTPSARDEAGDDQ